MKKLLLSICVLCHSNPIWAGQDPLGGEYFYQLGSMVTRIRTAQYTVDICAEQYPETKQANQQALDQWRARHGALISDVTRRFEGLPGYWAKLDRQSAKDGPGIWRKINAALDSMRGQLRQQFISQLGPEKFGQVCANYPQYLLAPAMDLDHAFVKEIRIIQRGPGK